MTMQTTPVADSIVSRVLAIVDTMDTGYGQLIGHCRTLLADQDVDNVIAILRGLQSDRAYDVFRKTMARVAKDNGLTVSLRRNIKNQDFRCVFGTAPAKAEPEAKGAASGAASGGEQGEEITFARDLPPAQALRAVWAEVDAEDRLAFLAEIIPGLNDEDKAALVALLPTSRRGGKRASKPAPVDLSNLPASLRYQAA